MRLIRAAINTGGKLDGRNDMSKRKHKPKGEPKEAALTAKVGGSVTVKVGIGGVSAPQRRGATASAGRRRACKGSGEEGFRGEGGLPADLGRGEVREKYASQVTNGRRKPQKKDGRHDA